MLDIGAAEEEAAVEPPPKPASSASGSHGLETIGIVFPNGNALTYYPWDGRFEAVCHNPAHKYASGKPCRLTRYLPEATDPDRPGKGRVIGQMSKWCLDGYLDGMTSGELHRDRMYVRTIPRNARRTARNMAYAEPNGQRLREEEPPKESPDADSEPELPY